MRKGKEKGLHPEGLSLLFHGNEKKSDFLVIPGV